MNDQFNLKRAHFIYQIVVGGLLFIFFAFMLADLLKWFEAQRLPPPTDTNVESMYHNEDSYPLSERPPTRM